MGRGKDVLDILQDEDSRLATSDTVKHTIHNLAAEVSNTQVIAGLAERLSWKASDMQVNIRGIIVIQRQAVVIPLPRTDVLHDILLGPLVDVAGKHVDKVVDAQLVQGKMLRAPATAVTANKQGPTAGDLPRDVDGRQAAVACLAF